MEKRRNEKGVYQCHKNQVHKRVRTGEEHKKGHGYEEEDEQIAFTTPFQTFIQKGRIICKKECQTDQDSKPQKNILKETLRGINGRTT